MALNKLPCHDSMYAGEWCKECEFFGPECDDRLRAAHLGISYDGYIIRKELLIRQAEAMDDTDKTAAA